MTIIDANTKRKQTTMARKTMITQLDKYIYDYCINKLVRDLIESTKMRYSIIITLDEVCNTKMIEVYDLDTDYVFNEYEYVLEKIKEELEKLGYKCNITSTSIFKDDKYLCISW